MYFSYFIIPVVAISVAWLGGRFTASSVESWYVKLRKPSWTPPGSVIGLVWTVLYVLAAISALTVWNAPAASIVGVPFVITMFFVLNAVLNVLWTYTFFYRRRIRPAIWVCLSLDLTIVILIQLIAPLSPEAAWLLVPYAAWVTFASYLNYRVWAMNRR